MNKSIWQDKNKWEGYRKTQEYTILGASTVPADVKKRVVQYKEGLYETPKTYEEGYAYNDGTWLIYNTCRITNGKFRNRMKCDTKDDVIKYAYSYLCFLAKVGITEKYEMMYYIVCFVMNKLAIPKGVFDKNQSNCKKLEDLVKSVMKKDVDCITCYRYDDRKFCISPKMENKDVMRQTKRKEMNYDRIMELYDPSKTLDQNVFNMKRNGVEVSNKTLRRCLKDRKVK